MNYLYNKPFRELIQLSQDDSFLVFDRVKDLFDYPLHYHPEFELNYIDNGEGVKRIVGDNIEVIGDKELVLVGPNLNHVWEQHECDKKDIREITIQFHNDCFNEGFLNKTILKPIKTMFDKAKYGIAFSKETVIAIEPKLTNVSKLNGISCFFEIFSILYDLAISKNQKILSSDIPKPENYKDNERLKKLNQFIKNNYGSKITLSEVSELLNVSTVSFNRFIKKQTEKTFIEYLNDIRIGHASKQLLETEFNISEIAYGCGFNNLAHFNRIFKNTNGVTPTVYRNNFLGVKRIF